jgi:hypothetical protein
MAEAGFAADGRWLDWLQLFRARLLKHGNNGLQSLDFHRHARCLERSPLFGGSSDDQHREAGRRDGGKVQTGFGVGKSQGFLATEQRLVNALVGLSASVSTNTRW